MTAQEVQETVLNGKRVEARGDRLVLSKNFPYGGEWKGVWFAAKGVQVIVVESDDTLIVVTV